MSLEIVLDFITGPYMPYAYFLVMLLCGFGVPLNSDLILLFMGSLISIKQLNPTVFLIIGILGVMLGDSLIYIVARYFGSYLIKKPPIKFLLTQKRRFMIESLINKIGVKVLFLVRFIPGTRTATLFSFGLFKIPASKAALINFVAICLWQVALVATGYYLVDSLDHAHQSLSKTLLFMFISASTLFFIVNKVSQTQFFNKYYRRLKTH